MATHTREHVVNAATRLLAYGAMLRSPFVLWVGGALLVALVGGVLGARLFFAAPVLETITVRSAGVGSVVSVQGTVVPREEVDLSFESVGTVESVLVAVGDTVARGALLATLSRTDLRANVENQEALRDAAQVRLEELREGTRPEDIAVAEAALATAQNDALQATHVLAQTLADTYEKLDDAVRTKTDMLFDNPRSAAPHLHIPADSAAQVLVENERQNLEIALRTIQFASFADPTAADIERARVTLSQARVYLDHIASILNQLQDRSSLPVTTIDSYKAGVGAARTALATFNASITTAYTAYVQAQSGVALAESQLTLKKAGPTPREIEAQIAQVRAAEAALSAARAALAKRIIVAPFSGTITAVGMDVGSVVGGTEHITLITAQALHMESYIPEVYIAKIAPGDVVEITLDAYPATETFMGTVSAIEPSATVHDGVSTYKVTIVFDELDERVLSGMSGDVRISASRSPEIITVPKTALVRRGEDYFVQIPAGEGRVIERLVLIGAFNEADVAEVISGLSDGDMIVRTPIQ